MVEDLQGCVEKLVEFMELGDVLTEADVVELLPFFTFDCMKEELNKFQPKSVTWKNNFSFLRKGQSGANKLELSNEDRKFFKEHLEKKQLVEHIKKAFGGTHSYTRTKMLELFWFYLEYDMIQKRLIQSMNDFRAGMGRR